jgi:meso-butanediol dehydrogenase/(S,S)-butanediol dehydrogenase/diacetyl reductase
MKNKSIIITGGASGMGAASARKFAESGANVTIVDINKELAGQVSNEINISEPIIGDIRDSAFCNQVIEVTIERYGKVDVLINCAGTILRADAENTTDEDWHRVMSTNVDGLFFMSRAAIKPMVKNGNGVIINFGSIWGSVGSARVVAYCASKGAVHQITRAMALDHAKDGIRINSVCPGEVNTPMLSTGRKSPPTQEDLKKLADETIPVARLAEPEEIANVVFFLASEDASYMTGSMVTIDGGFTAR